MPLWNFVRRRVYQDSVTPENRALLRQAGLLGAARLAERE